MNENKAFAKVPVSAKAGYSIGAISCAISSILATFITFFMTESIMVPIVTASLTITIVKVLDGVSDIVAGMIIDKTKSKWGKARPWFLWMAIPYGVCLAAIFYVSPEASITAKVLLVAIFDALTVSIFGTMLNVARYALIPRMTLDPKQQHTLSILGDGVLGIIGSVLVIVTNMFVYTMGFKTLFTIFGIIAIVFAIICFLLVRENEEIIEETQNVKVGELLKAIIKNKYAILTLIIVFFCTCAAGALQLGGLYYFNYYMQNPQIMSVTMIVSIIAGIVALFVIKLLYRFTEKVYGYSMIIAFILLLIGYLFGGPQNPVLVIVCMALGLVFIMNFGLSCFGVLTAKAVDYGEWKSGFRTEGMASTCANIGQKIGNAVGAALLGLVMGAGGFIEGGAEQSAAALESIRFGYTLLPAILCIISAIIYFICWRLDKQLPEIRKELAVRHGHSAESTES